MKKVIFLLISIVFSINTFSQDYWTTIKTPTNVTIEALHRAEYSSNDLALIEARAADWIDDHNSNAIRVAPASRTYNCHNYAWHKSDGGNSIWLNEKTQLNQTNLAKYWSGTDLTYQLTTSSNASKAFYPNGDHSAKKISTSFFESKWGDWPRYRHTPSDCPYTSTSLQYYKVPLNGEDLLCVSSNETYTTLDITNVTYDWDGIRLSTGNNNYSTVATGSSNGQGEISVDISSSYSGTTIHAEKDVWVGIPDVIASDVIISNPENSGNYACSGMDGNEFELPIGNYDQLEIKVTNLAGTTTYEQFYTYSSSGDLDIGGLAEGYYLFWVRGENDCGWNAWSDTEIEVVNCGRSMYYLEFMPNPVITETTVELKRFDKEKVEEIIEWEFEIYDMSQIKKLKTYKFHGKKRKINTNGWKDGVYIVRAIVNDEMVTGKFIVKK